MENKTRLKLPEYLKRPIAALDNIENKKVKQILKENSLNTVCQSARCPNKCQCYSLLTATFLIMGNVCTRNCKFCNIEQAKPEKLDVNEPKNIAKATLQMHLKYTVITSVTRDDLKDGGAEHFSNTILEIKKLNPGIKIEILTPDFRGDYFSINTVLKAKPDVFNHNIETVKRLYPIARQMADYRKSLDFLSYIKIQKPDIITKTGIMTGLGENIDELSETLEDIKKSKVDILTIGQYIQPSKKHLNVEKYYSEDDFFHLKEMAHKIGIKHVVSAPLARSSYMAYETYLDAKNNKN